MNDSGESDSVKNQIEVNVISTYEFLNACNEEEQKHEGRKKYFSCKCAALKNYNFSSQTFNNSILNWSSRP